MDVPAVLVPGRAVADAGRALADAAPLVADPAARVAVVPAVGERGTALDDVAMTRVGAGVVVAVADDEPDTVVALAVGDA
jgi:hypothetical protein